ncbi:MAG TPA: polyketide synthase dehydratase domain-containing protein, partial [Chitinophaga sp.]|uniref:polyketide synthase dehydratase domain-containing protein n=1 Tax=Chitinophaga sp. TaxID=1869181 RepID=UPI002BB28409
FRVPADVKPELLMVTVVDAAFQSVLALMEDEQAAAEDLWLPFALEQFYIGATPTNEGYVYITPGSKEGNNKLRYFDLLITTAAGGIVAALSDFTVKSIPARPQNGHARPAGKTVSMDQMIALMKQVESGHITAMEAEKILLQH